MTTVLELGPLTASVTDLVRLVAVPVFGWATWRDIETRRVPNETWVPLLVLGLLTLAWDAWLAYSLGGYDWSRFALGAVISIGFVIPLAYAFWLIGGFGGADVKALIVLAILFPVFPTYFVEVAGVPALPAQVTTTRSFAFTILTNTVLLGIVYPVGLALRNLLRGHTSLAMFVGKPVHWSAIPEEHGRLLENEDGLTRGGLDLDALRMYLRWRGTTLPDVRDRPDELRDPESLPASPNPPTDGNVGSDAAALTDGGTEPDTTGEQTPEQPAEPALGAEEDEENEPVEQAEDEQPDQADPWGAAAFLDDVEHAYGTSPAQLRAGLEVLSTKEVVWISPGIPFIVPMFGGLVVGLLYGDLLFGALRALGLA